MVFNKAKPEPKPSREEEEDASKKRKAEEDADPTAEPKKAAKKAETEEDPEKETDAPADSQQTLKQAVSFEPHDCTLNVMPTTGGKVLTSLSEGGMQYLIAGARANVGIIKGRYMYECKVISALNPMNVSGVRGSQPVPRQLLRLGFSTSSGSLLLGDDAEGVCFDAQGVYTADKKTKNVSQRFGKDMTMACLLNLDEKSDNYFTISLFKNGERITPPQPLPESLKGKVLFPHVSYRNVSVQIHFGPEPLKALPFKCNMVGGAAEADVSVTPATTSKDGKCEVVFPVAFPDEGTFEWLDSYLQKNPRYVELSDRKILEWAAKSGLTPKSGTKTSNDKPEFNYTLPAMNDMSVRRVLQTVAPLVPRNYVVMEVKENLVADDRKTNLKRFKHSGYKKVAHVIVGEPSDNWKEMQHERLLKVKKEKAEAEWKRRKEEKERKKALEERQKQLADIKKRAEEAKKKEEEMEAKRKAEEEAKQKAEIAKQKKEANAKAKAERKAKKAAEKEARKKEREEKGEEPEEEEPEAEEEEEEEPEEAEEETKEEETKEEAAEEGKKEEVEEEKEEVKKEEEDEDEPMPDVELTEEEKQKYFSTPTIPDLTPQVLNLSFAKFTIPDDSEGFDDVRFEWQKKDAAVEYIRNWVLERKKTAKIEHLQPSQWFKDKHAAFEKALKEWQDKQKPFKFKKGQEVKKKKGDEEEEEAEEEGAKGPEEVDIFALKDINDTGNGEPLYKDFAFEDWALVTLRWELYLLTHAFMKDVDDVERVGIHESNVGFYYAKYYRKMLNCKHYGKDTDAALMDLIKDTVIIDSEKSVLSSQLNDDVDALDIIVKSTEECRRERQRRVDAGDDTSRLQFSVMSLQQNTPKSTSKAVPPPWKPGTTQPRWKPGAKAPSWRK